MSHLVSRPRTARHVRAVLLLLAAVVAVLVLQVSGSSPARAADPGRFDPGNLISDTIFHDSTSMSAAQVQSFLDARGARCVPAADGTACLKDYRQTTTSRPADSSCPGAYTGARDETAAQIITKVARACGINPRVLLVTLQKEQSLVTRTTAGSAAIYQKAMGYGCPDFAACDSRYYGFFNQVYSAASRFQYYADNPTRFAHRAGAVNQVRYHPNAACGSSPVYIRNQATAGLYNYTPYQPNAAALAAGYGTGDSCSAYGNRNFWSYFSDWFGSPTGVPPIGFLDAVDVSELAVTATGWALDPDTSAPIAVHVYVDGRSVGATADRPRPDVGAAFGRGDAHGFSVTTPATAGQHEVCVWALNSDVNSSNSPLGCRTVTVPRPLTGFLDSVTVEPGGVSASGWVYDPDSPTTRLPVALTLDGTRATVTADVPRADLAAAFGTDGRHGFTGRVRAPAGTYELCVTAASAAKSVQLGCRTVTITNSDPVGFLDAVTTDGGAVTARGWALDPDTTAPITVHMYVDGASAAFRADGPRPDVGRALGRGDDHGFTTTMPATPGRHTVCLYAINTAPGPNAALGCRTVTVADSAPVGFLDAVTTDGTTVTARGWALDPDTTAPITVHMYVDGASAAFRADGPRPDVGRALGRGDHHGFTTSMTTTPGAHTVCLYAMNAGPGPNALLGCRSVTVVSTAPPVGFLDDVTTDGTTVTARGWALDPDTTSPIAVHMYVDGASAAFTADGPRPDVGRALGRGDNHGFTTTMATTPGRHSVCVYAMNAGPGVNPLLGCRSVTVG